MALELHLSMALLALTVSAVALFANDALGGLVQRIGATPFEATNFGRGAGRDDRSDGGPLGRHAGGVGHRLTPWCWPQWPPDR